MKKYLLLFATMFSFGAAMAQLTVESSGNVHDLDYGHVLLH